MEPPAASPVPPEEEERLRSLLERWYALEERGASFDPALLAGEAPGVVSRFTRIVGRTGSVLDSVVPSRFEPVVPVERLGPYRLLREVGAGGMGRVFVARDASLNRLVAVKLLQAGAAASPPQRARFRREAEVTAALEHENIVPVYAVGEEGPWLYFAMKWIEGPSLADRGKLEPREVAQIGAVIADALDAAHAQGILHRDVKPSNVMFDGRTPVLLDFGLARPLDGPSLTEGDAVPGTLPYIAPERLHARDVLDPRADVYSLAATLFEALAGTPPFAPDRPRADLVRDVLEHDPPALKLPRKHRDLETILRCALQKDRRRRFDSAAAFARDLRRYLGGRAIQSRRVGPAARAARLIARHRLATAAVGTLLLGAAVFATVILVRIGHERSALKSDLGAVAEHLALGRLAAARVLMDRIVARHPNDPQVDGVATRLEAREALEDLMDGLHDFSAVRTPGRLATLEKVLCRVDPRDLPQPLTSLARALARLHRRQPQEALKVLEALPTAARQGRAARALRAVAEGRLPRPGAPGSLDPEANVLTAMALRLAGAPIAAQAREIDAAFAADPTQYRVLLGRARLLLEQGEAKHALGLYESLHGDATHRGTVAYGAARACLDLGRLDEAERWATRAPPGNDVQRDTFRADVMRHRGDPDYGPFLEAACARWPDDPEFLRYLGQHLHEKGKLARAQELLERARAVAITPDEARLIEVRLVEIRFRSVPETGADAVLRELRSRLESVLATGTTGYTQGSAHYLLGWITQRLDDPELARRHLERAVAADPRLFEATFTHARLLGDLIRPLARREGLAVAADELGDEAARVLDRLEANLASGAETRTTDAAWLAVGLAALLPTRQPLEEAVRRLERVSSRVSAGRRRWCNWLLRRHPDQP